MKNKHTPGPWVWNNTRSRLTGANDVKVLQDGEGIWDLCSYVSFVEGKPKQAIANACLISAAPDLLSCLQSAVKSLEWAAAVIKDIPPNSEYMEGLREARSAIAKAEGTA